VQTDCLKMPVASTVSLAIRMLHFYWIFVFHVIKHVQSSLSSFASKRVYTRTFYKTRISQFLQHTQKFHRKQNVHNTFWHTDCLREKTFQQSMLLRFDKLAIQISRNVWVPLRSSWYPIRRWHRPNNFKSFICLFRLIQLVLSSRAKDQH